MHVQLSGVCKSRCIWWQARVSSSLYHCSGIWPTHSTSLKLDFLFCQNKLMRPPWGAGRVKCAQLVSIDRTRNRRCHKYLCCLLSEGICYVHYARSFFLNFVKYTEHKVLNHCRGWRPYGWIHILVQPSSASVSKNAFHIPGGGPEPIKW